MEKTLLDLSREIHAISKNGLAFTKDPFDVQRFKQLEEIAAQLISKYSVHSKVFLNKVFSADQGYTTPKIDVRAAVFNGERLLFVKEKESDAWTLPGGYVDVNESLSVAVEKEVLEESGFQVKSRKVAAIYDHRKHGYKPHLYHFYKIYMICDLLGGSQQDSIETTAADFYSREQVEDLNLDSARITRVHALRMFEHYLQPGLPTEFD